MPNKKGFTLIELIVVVAILGILALILVPAFNGYIKDTKLQVAKGHAKIVEIALKSANAKLSATGESDESIIFNGNETEDFKETIIKEIDSIVGDLKGNYSLYYTPSENQFIVIVKFDDTYYEFDCSSGSPVLL